MKEETRKAYHNKPKREVLWRDAATDVTESAKITMLFKFNEDKITNFSFKTRQLATYNTKEMVRTSCCECSKFPLPNLKK